ncbi:excinuclease ABC subunit UvrC [Candidatus Daviesbacteria bacterium]|nr:excinuclease ABC subunit UvrC [Candidatus Daviesbacteria bacterium]
MLNLPHKPGVYLFKNKQGEIIYVGKAIDLKSRVSSPRSWHWDSVETIVVESELEALILEANLIKKYVPKFNVRLTDDKDYLYIKITKEYFPRILTARKQGLKNSLKYFGPFPSSRTVRETLKSLRKVFPWCSNLQSRFVGLIPNRDWKMRPCFYYHLELCPGACTGLISQPDYKKIIKNFIKFLSGKKEKLIKDLTKEMLFFAKNQKFEEAAKIKKTLDGISYLTQSQRASLYLENPNFLEEEKKLALKELQKVLSLKKIPARIEGYDISNIQGKEATGSMVVLTSGDIDKSQYRKFKIKIENKPNDVAMMKEMLERRLKNDWPMPDLIMVDGGRGQARAIKSKIPIFGLAKRLEWLYPPEGKIVKLPKRSLALKLLQKLRDEAHRFAITYHRKLRDRIIDR